MGALPFKLVGLSRIRQEWEPSGEGFLVEAHAEVSLEGEPGGEAFRVTVTSPSTLADGLASPSNIEAGRGYMFMKDYDERAVVYWLQRLLDRSGARSWDELRAVVELYFDWID